MKPLRVVAFVFLAGATSHGGPTEDAIAAAMRLADQPSYSWVSTVSDDARTYRIEGKTQRGGYTWVRLPMIPALAKRLGRDVDVDFEAVFRGHAPRVILTNSGWKALDDLPQRHSDWRETDPRMIAVHHSAASISPFGLGGFDPLEPPTVTLYRVPAATDDSEERRYSNAQFAPGHPHEDLQVMIGSCVRLKADGDTVTGVLSELGAQLLLVREGQNHITPLAAAGSFKLQIKNGRVVKYVVRLEGILQIARKKFHVHQLASTVVKDVGTTRFVVPQEALSKLTE